MDRRVKVVDRTVKVMDRRVKVVDRTAKVVDRTAKIVDSPIKPYIHGCRIKKDISEIIWDAFNFFICVP